MRTRARIAAAFAGLALAGIAAPAAVADDGPVPLADADASALGLSSDAPSALDGMNTFGNANLVLNDLVNDPVNEVLGATGAQNG